MMRKNYDATISNPVHIKFLELNYRTDNNFTKKFQQKHLQLKASS
jgi:hypothetical protein